MQNVELKAIANAIAQIREQLPEADTVVRSKMLQELETLREMATSILDAWMEVDDAIEETLAQISEASIDASIAAQGDQAPQYTASLNAGAGVQQSVQSRTESLLQAPVQLAETWFDMSLRADCALRKGLGYFDLRMFDEAALSLTQAVAEQDNPATRIYLALSHLAANRVDLAVSHLNVARVRANDDVTVRAVLEVDVQICAAREDWHQAVHVLYELLCFDPTQLDTWYNLGVCHLKLYEFAAAERCFAKSMKNEPTDVEAALWRAMSLVLCGRVDEARQLLTTSTHLARNVEEHALLRVVLHLSTQRIDLAERAAIAASAAEPNSAFGYELLALCRAVSHRPDEAIPLCKRALALSPNSSQALTLFGLCSYLTGDLQRAERALKTVEERGESSGLTHVVRARIATLNGLTADALERLGRLSEHPGMYAKRLAVLYRGMLHLSENEIALAEADFERALHLGLPPSAIDIARAHARSGVAQRS
ncbi:tetratricopeptide repeat protein [Alicyclobacillus fastidiosus]|uniref:Tetratricopeptide repeat protein n=1 Tax=Alicyclobacillus fastidiosus TaxID=392011 RepID=A0ABY6Z9X5_9BACL|nr:tetratricopeptide repeat protein [Alicyclobacillus fastidiosus]WAH39679.1 tetratricopeptide repeat protein [Alicyclobacillus fastidiosus]GMA60891.1 hypothetical protein GCM10025859_13310 [Alicyclobacillus fastidiosus]